MECKASDLTWYLAREIRRSRRGINVRRFVLQVFLLICLDRYVKTNVDIKQNVDVVVIYLFILLFPGSCSCSGKSPNRQVYRFCNKIAG